MHSGEEEPTDGDYFGVTATRTGRVIDAGNGGQILVSEAARRLLGDRPPAGMSLVDAGEHRLKDLGEPTRIYRLMVDGADDLRRLRTFERSPHNLPIQLSTFIGRQGRPATYQRRDRVAPPMIPATRVGFSLIVIPLFEHRTGKFRGMGILEARPSGKSGL